MMCCMRMKILTSVALIALAAWLMLPDAEPERSVVGCANSACLELVVRGDMVEVELSNNNLQTGTVRVELGGQPLGVAVVPAGQTRVLGRATADQLRQGSLSWWFIPVEAGAVHAPGVLYRFPFRGRWTLTQGNHGQYSHFDEQAFAFDFRMDEGTPIVAARAGFVVWVVTHHAVGGTNPSLIDKANFVTVLHEDGTLANYTHLCPDGAIVAPGDRVELGDTIGFSGNTGYSSEPHLHFHVWRLRTDLNYESLPIRFADRAGRSVIPMEGGIYGH
jgi:murein DD-endopeptidase MepM/ murein hydrolase activator NlpD